MIKTTPLFIGASVLACLCASGVVEAAPTLRVSVDQRGDFLLIGNTLGYECTNPVAPVVGSVVVDACNRNGNDTSPDLFWRADEATIGQATASRSYTSSNARTSSVLAIPSGATVTHAFLYWAAKNDSATGDTEVTLERTGTEGFSEAVTALTTYTASTFSSTDSYESVADITSLVQQYGSGAYRVSGIEASAFARVTDETLFGAWTMVVFYTRQSDTLRNLTLFDGLDAVSSGSNQTVTLSDFLVPNAGFDGKLGVIAYEGDSTITGDQLYFNGGTALSDAVNLESNFFNGSRSWLGAPVSVAGDLPQLTGERGSMPGVDFDVVDITSKLSAGMTSAPVQATSTGDVYLLGAFVTSISTYRPNFAMSTKTVTDVNGGSVLPGDVLEYAMTVTNTGDDDAIYVALSDALPMGVTYVPGSLQITAGENAGTKTDAANDDQGEYDASTRTVTVRLGETADAIQGGTIAVGDSATVVLQVTVDSGFTGTLSNQATITAAGEQGAPATDTPTSSDSSGDGSSTDSFVDQCDAANTGCGGTLALCNTSASPAVCVECLSDGDCGASLSGRVCDTSTNTCVDGCRATGNGCPVGSTCSSTDSTPGTCTVTETSTETGSGGNTSVDTTTTTETGSGGDTSVDTTATTETGGGGDTSVDTTATTETGGGGDTSVDTTATTETGGGGDTSADTTSTAVIVIVEGQAGSSATGGTTSTRITAVDTGEAGSAGDGATTGEGGAAGESSTSDTAPEIESDSAGDEGGCNCVTAPGHTTNRAGWFLGLAVAATGLRRRRCAGESKRA